MLTTGRLSSFARTTAAEYKALIYSYEYRHIRERYTVELYFQVPRTSPSRHIEQDPTLSITQVTSTPKSLRA